MFDLKDNHFSVRRKIMEWLLDAYDHSSEKEILNSVSREVPWKLVEYFSRLKRDSGTEGEREAARYITNQLESFGILLSGL